MKKTDGRKLSAEKQNERRKRIVELRQKGKTNLEISKLTGCCLSHVSTIWKSYENGGMSALDQKDRGRKEGEGRNLDHNQERLIKEAMVKCTPDEYRLGYYLWSRETVISLIANKFDLDIPPRTITDYLKRWGFSPKKPVKTANGQADSPYLRWLKNGYQKIVKQAITDDLEIHWIDNVSVRSDINKRIGMLSSITNQGQVRFMLYERKITFNKFTKFIDHLIDDTKRSIYLIFYNNEIICNPTVDKWYSCKSRLMKKNENRKLEIIYLEGDYLGRLD